jgi:hypothetical protein
VSVALISTDRGVFIGVQGGVADLVKSVTRQVVADQPSHVVSRPWSSASTNLQLGIPLYHLLESVTAKPTCKMLQGGAKWPATPWAHWSATFAHCPLMSGTPPGWHLFWWNFKFPCNFLKCSNLASMFLKSNKYYNRGTRLVDKVNAWLFYTFAQHVGAWNRCFMSANIGQPQARNIHSWSHLYVQYWHTHTVCPVSNICTIPYPSQRTDTSCIHTHVPDTYAAVSFSTGTYALVKSQGSALILFVTLQSLWV